MYKPIKKFILFDIFHIKRLLFLVSKIFINVGIPRIYSILSKSLYIGDEKTRSLIFDKKKYHLNVIIRIINIYESNIMIV